MPVNKADKRLAWCRGCLSPFPERVAPLQPSCSSTDPRPALVVEFYPVEEAKLTDWGAKLTQCSVCEKHVHEHCYLEDFGACRLCVFGISNRESTQTKPKGKLCSFCSRQATLSNTLSSCEFNGIDRCKVMVCTGCFDEVKDKLGLATQTRLCFSHAVAEGWKKNQTTTRGFNASKAMKLPQKPNEVEIATTPPLAKPAAVRATSTTQDPAAAASTDPVASASEKNAAVDSIITNALDELRRVKGERLADLLTKHMMLDKSSGSQTVLFSKNIAPHQGVRLRPSFQQRVLGKVKLLITAGWPAGMVMVVRALPGTTEEKNGEVVFKQDALQGVCSTTVDGHHRHEAVVILEGLGYGPEPGGEKTWTKWPLGVIPLKEDCPDEDCRAIAWALTDHQKLTHAMNSVDTLHAVSCCVEARKKKQQQTTVEDLEKELNCVTMDEDKLRENHIQTALDLYRLTTVEPKDGGLTAYQEIMRLSCCNHEAVFNHLKAMNAVLENVKVTGVADAAACFIPKFGSGRTAGGGFVPCGMRQGILVPSKTLPSFTLAMFRRAYGYWITTGGLFLTKKDYEELAGTKLEVNTADRENATKWAKLQLEDYLLITNELASHIEPTEVQALEVLAFAGLRLALHEYIIMWRPRNSRTDFVKSHACISECEDPRCKAQAEDEEEKEAARAEKPPFAHFLPVGDEVDPQDETFDFLRAAGYNDEILEVFEDDLEINEVITRSKSQTATPAAKPAATPAAKPAAKPSAKPAAKPSAKPAAKPSAKPATTGEEEDSEDDDEGDKGVEDDEDDEDDEDEVVVVSTKQAKSNAKKRKAAPASQPKAKRQKPAGNKVREVRKEAVVAADPKPRKQKTGASFTVCQVSHKKLMEWAHDKNSQAKPLSEKDFEKFPSEFSKPKCVFTRVADWFPVTSAKMANHDTRQQKVNIMLRAIQKMYAENSPKARSSDGFFFALLCRVPWHLWCVANGLSNMGFYVGNPISCNEPDFSGGKDAAHIVLACKSAVEWVKINEAVHSDVRHLSWDTTFSSPNFNSIPLPGFDFASQLAAWFVSKFTKKDDVVWLLNSDKNPEFAVCAVACGCKVAVSVDCEKVEEKVIQQVEAAEMYACADSMWKGYSSPERVFTILALAKISVVTQDLVADSVQLLINSSKPTYMHDWPQEKFRAAPEIPDNDTETYYEVKPSTLKTTSGKPVGLGVFTRYAFQKGKHALTQDDTGELKAQLMCEGFYSDGEKSIGEWRGWPWNIPELPGVKFCSSHPQMFDYINDPKNLVDAEGEAVKANVKVSES